MPALGQTELKTADNFSTGMKPSGRNCSSTRKLYGTSMYRFQTRTRRLASH